MTNTLYLPELREALANQDADELREFCNTLHPANTADFIEGLTIDEAWQVLSFADDERRAEIFRYFSPERQQLAFEKIDREEISKLIDDLPADERVDILNDVDQEVVDELLPLVPADDRRDILRLQAYPEETAGAVMTTEFARLAEKLTVADALDELRKKAQESETIYYLYVVDDEDHLRGLVSLRQLVSAQPNTLVSELMTRDVIAVDYDEDQEEVARVLARYDFLAIPVVDRSHHLLGIITHDDIIDVVRAEATEDAHQMGAIDPLEETYLNSAITTITWKRGIWLTVLFFGALVTAVFLHSRDEFKDWPWLIPFLPLVIATGGNTGAQSCTLVITALATGDVKNDDWTRVVRRELSTGLILSAFLATVGFVAAGFAADSWVAATVVPTTLVLIILCGTLLGALLPMLFRRLGLDPAIMSTPVMACIIDVLGCYIYVQVAILILS